MTFAIAVPLCLWCCVCLCLCLASPFSLFLRCHPPLRPCVARACTNFFPQPPSSSPSLSGPSLSLCNTLTSCDRGLLLSHSSLMCCYRVVCAMLQDRGQCRFRRRCSGAQRERTHASRSSSHSHFCTVQLISQKATVTRHAVGCVTAVSACCTFARNATHCLFPMLRRRCLAALLSRSGSLPTASCQAACAASRTYVLPSLAVLWSADSADNAAGPQSRAQPLREGCL